ncbi:MULTISPECIES: gamma-glutamyltransferase family protein [unclassified Mesorhizobium]|uniref:gamma-glutamyltransferase family protein n=1 Tax=unclassified Mesorhizobium TaxID=325217 RepID=UPI0024151FFD|nr:MULTISPECIES: gamma-glutamyltransferase family protein [unclassified Mesorhizobium]MDG4889937.1 gamma-glutamyltransferase family protein [Mesorhizobium sp. WSM4887]MDG4904080.1 gamma-glutamyltransferase family protein [Mesorhizobium sp. WSM4962]MDG4909107.1 gamma-glutamyltransferase family protein [Mesorhizobium sp. WSM4898]MDG4921731.1 gamma-glutamyltransferase family protein [Mesorhizobium sp. WSM4989]
MNSVRTWRPLIMGNAAVATNHPAATQVGLDVLKSGGNAVDAAFAVALSLGVAEPFMSGIGGDGFYHVHDGQGYVYEGVGCAPLAARADAYPRGLPENGPMSISAPGSVAALFAMHTNHGRKSVKELAAPAVQLARRGVPVGHTYRRSASTDAWRFETAGSASSRYLLNGGVPDIGMRIMNPRLAETLEALAEEGLESFYRGRLARAIAQDLHALGSLVTRDDLAAVESCTRESIKGRYRGYEILQTPSVSTGFALLQQLAMLDLCDVSVARDDPATLIHLMVEIKKLAFLDRERYAGDPRYIDFDPGHLLDQNRLGDLVSQIDLHVATDRPIAEPEKPAETTYFCIADREGQVVSAIQSLNATFGSGVMLPQTGILMNNRMCCWHLASGHPNALVPGKKVRHTMNAPILLKDGQVRGVLGTPGADNQVQVNFQAIVGLIDLGLDPQTVAEAPRWSSDQCGQGANWPHAGQNTLTVENQMPEGVKDDLKSRGHTLKTVGTLEGPCSLEIIKIQDNGLKIAGSDPRRDGWAAAFD